LNASVHLIDLAERLGVTPRYTGSGPRSLTDIGTF